MLLHKRVRRIGGSLHVLIPSLVAEALGIKDGDPIELKVEEDRLAIRKEPHAPARAVAHAKRVHHG